ncbi:MAG: NHLP leader peptide family RiPP precursor [Thermoleophilia bacterium]|jgi:hypothetical protein
MAIEVNLPQIDEAKASAFLATYSEVVQKAWNDPAFKAQLVADPTGTLRAAGVDIPADMEIKLVEHAAGEKEGHTVVTLPLPAAPTEHLDDDALLAAINGGSSCNGSAGSASSASCPSCSASSSGCAGSAC